MLPSSLFYALGLLPIISCVIRLGLLYYASINIDISLVGHNKDDKIVTMHISHGNNTPILILLLKFTSEVLYMHVAKYTPIFCMFGRSHVSEKLLYNILITFWQCLFCDYITRPLHHYL
jgi:hypothetical protein